MKCALAAVSRGMELMQRSLSVLQWGSASRDRALKGLTTRLTCRPVALKMAWGYEAGLQALLAGQLWPGHAGL